MFSGGPLGSGWVSNVPPSTLNLCHNISVSN